MHVHLKNCLVAFQGSYQGQEKFVIPVLEAVANNNLLVWHAAFGLAGRFNILDVNALCTHFWMDNRPRLIWNVLVGDFQFKKIFYLVDGIYPPLS